MIEYRVVFTPEASAQLAVLYRMIATAASPEIAARYTDAIVTYCEKFQNFPQRGARRDEIRTGVRIAGYRKRTVIAFVIQGETVFILGVFHGGQDYEAALRTDQDE